jgi:hypothetical protein
LLAQLRSCCIVFLLGHMDIGERLRRPSLQFTTRPPARPRALPCSRRPHAARRLASRPARDGAEVSVAAREESAAGARGMGFRLYESLSRCCLRRFVRPLRSIRQCVCDTLTVAALVSPSCYQTRFELTYKGKSLHPSACRCFIRRLSHCL